MKKNLLALSIAAMVGGLSGVANAQAVITDTTGFGGRLISNAVNFGTLAAPAPGVSATDLQITPSGVGHILFVPYFTTQGSNMTLLNLVNTDQVNGKAVKLRFRGASNSDDLFDITVYLSPGDAWTAYVNANGDLSALNTSDTSCTLPSAAQIKETAGKFSTNRVLNNAAAETREGYVEILNMADIPPRTAPNGANSALYNAIKHVDAKAPCTAAVMNQQAEVLVPFDRVNDPVTRGYSWPTGGLMANWTLVDTSTNASFSGEAVAVRAVGAATNRAAANLVFSPQTTDRSGVVGFAAALTADPLLKNDTVRIASYDLPDLSTPYTSRLVGGLPALNTPEDQARELSDALATTFISNEFITDSSVSFATDWVFSMPTRRYAVALNYAAAPQNRLAFNRVAPTGFATNPYFTEVNTSLNREGTRACVDAGQLVAYDREETTRTSFVISPDDILKFCGETSVLTFNGKASVLGAKLAVQDIPTKFVDGWLNIETNGLNRRGLPVMGYAVAKAVGEKASNFGGTWMHRTSR